jgi:hypothetical protein
MVFDAKILGTVTVLVTLALFGYHNRDSVGFQSDEPSSEETPLLTYNLIECAPKFGLADHVPLVQSQLARAQAAEISEAIAMTLDQDSALRKMLLAAAAQDSAADFEQCSGLREGYLEMVQDAKPKTSSYRTFLKACANCAANAMRRDAQPFPTEAMSLDLVEMLSVDWLQSSSYLLEYASKYKPVIAKLSSANAADFRDCMDGTTDEPGAPRGSASSTEVSDNAVTGSRSLLSTFGDHAVTMQGAMQYMTGLRANLMESGVRTETAHASPSASSRRLQKSFFSGFFYYDGEGGSVSNCFGEEGLAVAAEGSTIRIADVRVGDKLQTSVANDEVYYVLEVAGSHKVLRVGTADGNSVVLTPHHLVATQDKGMVAAQSVKVGDSLIGSDGLTQVLSVGTEQARVRSPITMSGTIIVDGVLASCYGGVTHHAMHQILAPFRFLYGISPTITYFADVAFKSLFTATINAFAPGPVQNAMLAATAFIALSVPVALPVVMYSRFARTA